MKIARKVRNFKDDLNVRTVLKDSLKNMFYIYQSEGRNGLVFPGCASGSGLAHSARVLGARGGASIKSSPAGMPCLTVQEPSPRTPHATVANVAVDGGWGPVPRGNTEWL